MDSEDTATLSAVLDGLNNDELVYYYQPKVSLITGKVCGAEALLRWVRPDGTVVPPDHFIPDAERVGMITQIGMGMFPRLISDLLILHDIDDGLTISFNLSARDFTTGEMLELIQAGISNHQIDPTCIQVELTEASVLNYDDAEVRDNVRALVELGVTLAMDDYGTGYSSIDTLSQWPFHIVKLDQGLIRRMAESDKSTTIVQASIHMAHQLGMEIVAEGVETQGLYEFLLHAGCTDAQGFWLGMPMPLDQFVAFLREDRRWSGLPTGLIHMALLDHVNWRQALIAQVMAIAFNGEARAPEVRTSAAELNPHRCKLGQWYYGLGQEFRGIEAFDELEAPHNRLHTLGGELLEVAERGASRSELVKRLRALTRESAHVLELLQELESEALMDHADFAARHLAPATETR